MMNTYPIPFLSGDPPAVSKEILVQGVENYAPKTPKRASPSVIVSESATLRRAREVAADFDRNMKREQEAGASIASIDSAALAETQKFIADHSFAATWRGFQQDDETLKKSDAEQTDKERTGEKEFGITAARELAMNAISQDGQADLLFSSNAVSNSLQDNLIGAALPSEGETEDGRWNILI